MLRYTSPTSIVHQHVDVIRGCGSCLYFFAQTSCCDVNCGLIAEASERSSISNWLHGVDAGATRPGVQPVSPQNAKQINNSKSEADQRC